MSARDATQTTTTTIVVADDHPVVRAGLRALLNEAQGFEVVGEAADGGEAVDLVDRLAPHVVLMDFDMPVLDGVTATREIRRKHPDIRVLVLTTFETKADVARALAAGAIRCVPKDAPRGAIIASIRAAVDSVDSVDSIVSVDDAAPAEAWRRGIRGTR